MNFLKSTGPKHLSLVIPCYNEAANLPLLVDRCRAVVERPDCEVILVDNGSSDNSSDVLHELLPQYQNLRSVRVERNQGYGFGILAGPEAATGDVLGWPHADMQTDPQDALHGLELFETHGPDIFVKGLRYGRPLSDVVFTVGMSLFETALLGKVMWDINAQPTMFSRKFFKSWNKPPHDFSIDLFVYYQAKHARLPIHRLPVQFRRRAHGVSHWNINWQNKLNFIRRTVSYSLHLRRRLH